MSLDKKESLWQSLCLKVALFFLRRVRTSLRVAYALEFITAYLYGLGNGQGKVLTYASYNPKYKDHILEIAIDRIDRLPGYELGGVEAEPGPGWPGPEDKGDLH